jgi:hypothetical protein
MAAAFRLRDVTLRRFGGDLLLTAYPGDPCSPA